MISKEEYKWLERHTDILNKVPNLDDYAYTDVKFKVYRPAHVQKIKDIFKDYKCVSGQNKNDIWVKIKGFTLDDFNDTAYNFNANLIYNTAENDINYILTDQKLNHKIVRRATPKLLSNLSNRKKLDIFFSFAQNLFPNKEKRLRQFEFIEQHSNKFFALLQLKIPADFMREEYNKVRKITAKIRTLPDIKNKLNHFQLLPKSEQQALICEVSRITAEINGVEPPKVHFISNKQANNDPDADWIQTDAFAEFDDIYINRDIVKSYSGIEVLTLAFHETTHIAQSHLDYKNFPEMEEMFSHRLNYLQNHSDTYSATPTEMVTYNLEQEFCQQLENHLNLKINDYAYHEEYDIAQQYIQKALRRAY